MGQDSGRINECLSGSAEMKILLANPPCRISINNRYERYFVRAGSRWPFSTLKIKNRLPEYVPFPFYLAYAAALLEASKYEVYVLDGVALNLSREEFFKKTLDIAPDVILFETSTPTINLDLEIVKELKSKSRMVIVLSGAHVTVFPKEVLRDCKYIDYILTGEYEINFLKLVDFLNSGIKSNITELEGICFRDNNQIVYKPNKDLVDLNKLFSPARHLFPSNDNNDLSLYWDGFCQLSPVVQLQASRGCPFRCNFCLWNQVIYKVGRYRMFPPCRVVDEMEECIKNYHAKELYFDDDSFTVNKKHVFEICHEIKRRSLRIKWSCMADVIVGDEEMVNVMADAGCIGIKFGIESANKEILCKVGKPLSLEKAKMFTKWCAKRKIKTHATFSFGLSGETKETMMETLNFAKTIDADSVQFSITTPFPGTKYYEELKKNNQLIAGDWMDYDGANSFVVEYDSISKDEVRQFYCGAFKIWLRNKVKNYRWWIRQIYFAIRSVFYTRGFIPVFKKIKSVIKLI